MGFVPHPDLKNVVRHKSVGIVSTQAVEDTFNHMKNSCGDTAKRKHRRPHKVMATVLAKEVLSTIHDYKDVDVDRVAEQPFAKLSVDTFRPSIKSASLPHQKIVSTSSSTPWPSLGAANYCSAHADLAMLSAANASGEWALLGDAWLGTLARPKHQLLIRDSSRDGAWLFAVRSWPDSAVLCLPAKVATVLGGEALFWEFDLNFNSAVLVPLWKLDCVEAVAYVWRAPLWQRTEYPRMRELPCALRAFSHDGGKPRPLLQVAAESAFWDVERSTLVKLGGYIGARIQSSMSLFEVVTELVKHIIPDANEERIMSIMKRRVALLARKNEWTDDLLQVDEAAGLLQPGDVKKLKAEQKAAQETKAEAVNFPVAYKVEAKRIVAAKETVAAEAKSKAKKRRKASEPAAEGVAYPARAPSWPEHSIPLELARTVKPEGGSLWRDVRHGSWQGHYPPFPRVGRSWARYGELPALTLVLQNLWGWWLLEHGLEEADCPVKGIFTEAPPAALANVALSSGSTT